MSLLTIIRDAALRVGVLPSSGTITAAISSLDLNIQQLVGFANDAGDELSERVGWRNLKNGGQVTGDGTSSLFQLPAEFMRMLETPILVSSATPTMTLVGPVNAEDLIRLKAFPANPIRKVWRLIGGSLEIWPAPASAEVISFEYYANTFAMNPETLERKSAFSSDSDIGLVDEKLIRHGTIWRWQQAKGLDYAEYFRRYESGIDRLTTADNGGARVVNMCSSIGVPDDWFPGTITYSGP